MKETIIILTILLIIFGGGIYTRTYIEQSSEEVISELENIKDKINFNENSEETNIKKDIKENANKIYEQWGIIDEKWSVIILHNELDLIQTSLISMKSNIETEDYKKSIEEIDKSIFLLEHILEKEKCKLKNIF